MLHVSCCTFVLLLDEGQQDLRLRCGMPPPFCYPPLKIPRRKKREEHELRNEVVNFTLPGLHFRNLRTRMLLSLAVALALPGLAKPSPAPRLIKTSGHLAPR